jgi:cytochrome c biogenesis protein CcdA
MNGDLPLALALTAGTVAAFNPCGFALLPAYIAFVVGGGNGRFAAAGRDGRLPAEDRGGRTPVAERDDRLPEEGGGGRRGALRRAGVLSVAMTAGFVTVFGLFGLVVTPLAVSVGAYLPWATIVIGAALVGLGGWSLLGGEPRLALPRLATGRVTASAASLYGYGLSYAVASLSCTIGPFLAVTSASLAAGGVLGSLAAFLVYALGMGLVVALLSGTAALARTAAVARLRGLLPYVPRISGALLVLSGLYVAYYGWYELRVFSGGEADDPVVGWVTAVSGRVSDLVALIAGG